MLGFSPRNWSCRNSPTTRLCYSWCTVPEQGALPRLGIKDEDGKRTVLHWGRQIAGGASHIVPSYHHRNQTGWRGEQEEERKKKRRSGGFSDIW